MILKDRMNQKNINEIKTTDFHGVGKAIAILCIAITCMIGQVNAQKLRIASYNIRYENTHDSGNLWAVRGAKVAALVEFHDFDVFGVQEALQPQLETLTKALPEYTYYGIGRDDGKLAGEHESIFYKKSKFTLLDKGDFWLSATPDVPSKSWDAPCCNRICSWVKLKVNKSGKTFYVFNAHYDYEKDYARNESSKLMLAKIKAIAAGSPVIMTGDINGGNATSWYKTLASSDQLKDSYVLAKNPYAPRGSFNGFGKENSDDLIDHIFCSKEFTVKKWGVLSDTYDDERFPSDHCPILAVLDLK